MASYLDRMRAALRGYMGQCAQHVLVRADDISLSLSHIEQVELDNDELRRENERLLKALAAVIFPDHNLAPTVAPPPMATDQCACGRPRIGCAYHG